MPIGTQFVRELRKGEEDAIDALLRAAFGGPAEAQLVRELRKAGAMAGEQVMPGEDGPVAYYALSHLVAPKGWFALAPVAVRPDRQRQGLGRRMIGQLAEWARLTKTPVVVLGDPGFYGRAGFSGAAAAWLTSPYPVEHLLLAGVTGEAPVQTLTYPAPFAKLD